MSADDEDPADSGAAPPAENKSAEAVPAAPAHADLATEAEPPAAGGAVDGPVATQVGRGGDPGWAAPPATGSSAATAPRNAPEPTDEAPANVSEIPSGFASVLFGRSAPEDLAGYGAAGLAKLVLGAYRHLAEPRRAHQHSIRVFDPDPADDERFAALSIVEVVNDDMPFLLDSTIAQLGDVGHAMRLVAHPIIGAERDTNGVLTHVDLDPDGGRRESLIHVHIDRLRSPADRDALVDALDKTYRAVRIACDDWQAMRARVRETIDNYRAGLPTLIAEEVDEAIALLEWLLADNFTFLGVRAYAVSPGDAAPTGTAERGGLGILRDPSMKVMRRGREFVDATPELAAFLGEPQALIVTKANVKSRVHRAAHMDYIGAKMFDAEGRLEGELRIVGLFTASVYTSPVNKIPYVRRKVASVLAAAQLDPLSHSGKVLENVLETYPRDELFQVGAEELAPFVAAVAALEERPRLRVLARVDRFNRFASVLTYIPRDRYDTRVRLRVGDYLAKIYDGRISATYPYYPDGPLVRTHYIVGHYEGAVAIVPRATLEAGVAAIVRTWSDNLREAVAAKLGASLNPVAERYATAFSAGYMEAVPASDALADIAIVETMSAARPHAVVLRRAAGEPATRAELKVFSRSRPMPLSERVPILEHMGFRVVSEQTFDIGLGADAVDDTWLHDMQLEHATGGDVDLAACQTAIEGVLDAVLRGDAESDGYNTLALAVGMGWRDIAMLRTLSRYLQQTRIRFSQDYMAATLVRYAATADKLVELVYARFDPRPAFTLEERAAREQALAAEIEAAIAAVQTLDEDRILRRFLNLVRAAVRTNFFQAQPSGAAREVVSFKFESRRIDNLPLPHPLYEIAVHSPRVEGVHLRFGKVARGGLRWSDRREDFRTEVLALVKAQQVKNAVIVPVGAKGGFVAKRLPPPSQRSAWINEGVAAYRTFVGALLDLTDNLDGDAVVPPANTIRQDGDDPYLVVAADKGTASFSDIANAVSLEHNHWLGDAFASGGSVGYDHKRMGITARGAWEAVKRHFRELDMDIQRAPFTAVGIGDMSGDVFGNGMLLSQETRLIAAFDHRHIFIDPNPDPARSWTERARLFALPGSTWQDYDAAVLSAGGGVYARDGRQVPLSLEARAVLGIDVEHPTPPEVILAILKARVDLLWFGGIGTYVRSSEESDDAVGDRANDMIRVTGDDLRCKVVGEGANLGITQRGRIQAASAGVRLNTDAIDNSGGVNTSDLEVNIKIALARPTRDGRLTEAGRRDLLMAMTDEVAALVLRNNYLQTLALSLAEHHGVHDIGFAQRLMHDLESRERLDRAVEYLPDDAAIAARMRAAQGLTRPELSVLMAYAKLWLHDLVLDSDLPDDPYLRSELTQYFPKELSERFPDDVHAHRLRREIVATVLANAIVNRGGPTMMTRVADETGADPITIARAFVIVRDVFGIEAVAGAIDALDASVAGALQLSLYTAVQDLLQSRTIWFIRNVDFAGGLAMVVQRFRPGVEEVVGTLNDIVAPAVREAIDRPAEEFRRQGVPPPLAGRIAALEYLQAAPDIVLVAEQSGRPTPEVAETFFAVDVAFGMGALAHAATRLPVAEYYDRLALDAALSQIETARRRLTAGVLAASPAGTAAADAVTAWVRQRGTHGRSLLASITSIAGSRLTLSKVTVVASQLGDLAAG